MSNYTLQSIGSIHANSKGFYIELDKQYIPALEGLDKFGYIQILWWFDKCDNANSRSKLTDNKPYKKGPEVLGTFATRSPERPNPIVPDWCEHWPKSVEKSGEFDWENEFNF